MKRIIAFALALVMCLGIAGCGDKKSASDDVVTLKWYLPGDNQPGLSEVLAEANKISEAKIGAKLDIQFIDTGAFDERMRMIMSSGEQFDLCFTGYINKYNTAARLGGLEPLEELLETTPALKEAIPEFFWQGAKVDGTIYAVPNQQIVATFFAAWTPKRLAEKYNLDVEAITEHTQLEPYLKAIKEGEDGMYPWRNNNAYFSVGANFEELTNAFGIRRGDESCEILFIDEQPEWIEGIKVRNSWFKKGYIRPDVVSVGDDTTDYHAGKYAISISSYKPGGEVGMSNTMGEPMVYTPNLGRPYLSQKFMTSTLTGISKNSKNKEKAIKLIELINTDKEYYNLICYGIEGKHYTKLDDNTIRLVENSNYKPNGDWKFGNQFNAFVTEGMDPDVWEQTEKMNNEAEVSPLLGFTLDTTKIETELAQCETIRKQYGFSFFMGASEVGKAYDEYLERMDKAGKDKIIKEIQSQVDAFLANKN